MYAVVDLEATGIKSGNPGHIIQIGITFVDDTTIQDTLTVDIKPPCSVDPHVKQLTGITDKRLQQAPFFEEVAEYIATVLEGCVFVAHNVAFDYTLLKTEFQRAGYPQFEMRAIDTIEWAKIICPMEKSYALKNMTQQRMIFNAQLHDAGSDSRATAELFVWLKQQTAQLPGAVLHKIRHLLDSKDDLYAPLFDVKPYQTPFELPFLDEINLETEPIKQAAGLKEQIVYTHGQLLPILRRINQPRQLILVDQLYNVTTDMRTQGQFMLSPRHFLNPDALTWCLANVSQLTHQEVRQLCSVLVWTQQTQTYVLSELTSLSPKMAERLAFMVTDKPVSPFFVAHLNHIKQAATVFMTYENFITHYELYRDYGVFHNRVLVVEHVYDYTKTLQQLREASINVYQLVAHAHQLKQSLEKRGDEQDILRVENIIEGYQELIIQLMRVYPKVFDQLSQKDVGTYHYFLDKKSRFPIGWLEQLRQHTLMLLSVLETDRSKWQVLHFVAQQERQMRHMLQSDHDTDYFAVSYQRFAQGKWLTLLHGQYACYSWLSATVYQDFSSVHYGGMFGEHAIAQNYIRFLLGDAAVSFETEDLSTIQKQRQIMVVSGFVVPDMKENLLVKKLQKLMVSLSQTTVFIVPNKQVVQKLKDSHENVVGVEFFQQKKRLVNDKTISAVVVTWQQLLRAEITLDNIEQVLLVKLPFDSPDSLQAQASRYFLTGEHHYFQTLALPNMLIHLQKIIQSMSDRPFYILDPRVVDSQYAKHIAQANEHVQFVRLEKLDFLTKWQGAKTVENR